jgi:hypothetical protein
MGLNACMISWGLSTSSRTLLLSEVFPDGLRCCWLTLSNWIIGGNSLFNRPFLHFSLIIHTEVTLKNLSIIRQSWTIPSYHVVCGYDFYISSWINWFVVPDMLLIDWVLYRTCDNQIRQIVVRLALEFKWPFLVFCTARLRSYFAWVSSKLDIVDWYYNVVTGFAIVHQFNSVTQIAFSIHSIQVNDSLTHLSLCKFIACY